MSTETFVSPSLLVPALKRDASARALETLSARCERLPVGAVLLYDFASTPSAALTPLAEQMNMLGEAGWDFAGYGPAPEHKKRALLKESVALHRLKGTRYAVQRSLDLLGVRSHITEWWQSLPPTAAPSMQLAPYTFLIDLWLTDVPAGQPALTPERAESVLRMVRFWKPARSNFRARVGVGMSTTTRCAALMRPAASTRLDMRPGPTLMHAQCNTRMGCTLRPAQRVTLQFIE